jgi:hypothetical protein
LGGEVRSARLFFVRKWLGFFHGRSVAGVPLGTAVICCCVFAAFGSLVLRWGDYRGFALLFFPARVFDDDPSAARIVQIEMLLAVIFLLTSLSSRLLGKVWHGRLATPLQKARHVGAWIILFISGFIFFYAVIGLYGIVKDYAVLPAFGFFNEVATRNLENLPILGDADFSLGFTGFVCLCTFLAILELAFEAERKIRHPSS